MAIVGGACGEDPSSPTRQEMCGGIACSREPVLVSGGNEYTAVSVGGAHACALTQNGEAWCWGSNAHGQLGAGSAVSYSAEPVPVAGGHFFTQISSGAYHSCALTSSGTAYCWGDASNGVLGTFLLTDECGTDQCSRSPVGVIGGQTFAKIDAGFNHTCALTGAGEAYCWGANTSGELGVGSFFGGSTLPERVSGGATFDEISAGDSYSCARSSAGNVQCWGSGRRYALGYQPLDNCPDSPFGMLCSHTPTVLPGTLQFGVIRAGDTHTCGYLGNGAVYCWGENGSGQLGATGIDRDGEPRLLGLSGKAVSLSIASLHGCAVTDLPGVYCWGSNTSGELGGGVRVQSSHTPVAVTIDEPVLQVSCGGVGGASQSCALGESGAVYCWGARQLGQLGDGRVR